MTFEEAQSIKLGDIVQYHAPDTKQPVGEPFPVLVIIEQRWIVTDAEGTWNFQPEFLFCQDPLPSSVHRPCGYLTTKLVRRADPAATE